MYNKDNFELTLKKKIFLSFLGITFLSAALFVALSSWTFNFDDTGWHVLSSAEVQNFFGKFGSYTSGFLLKEFGILTPIFIFLIFSLYGFKFLKHQIISKLWFKLILMLGLIVLLGILSQPLQIFLNTYLLQESKILTYEGISSNFYNLILVKVIEELNFGTTLSTILVNIIITVLSILIFIYIASTNVSELSFIKKIILPFYLPFYWFIQLLNNLLVKKYYFYPNQEDFLKENKKTLFNEFKNL